MRMTFDLFDELSCPHTGLSVLDDWVLSFGWIRWVSLLLPAPNHTSTYLCRKFSVVVEVTHHTFWFMTSSDFITITCEIQ